MSDEIETQVYSFIKLIDKYYVEIPKIQRDYAQGRQTDRVNEVRDDFLRQLKDYLDSPITHNNLDFVYGEIIKVDNKDKLLVLDGQQRLTTLFLLHWYTSLVANRFDEFKTKILVDEDSKFSYNTRESAKEFCKNLVLKGDVIYNSYLQQVNQAKQAENICLSKIIKDQTWFYINWINDLTIKSMLVMIDAIAKLFGDNNTYYDKLVDNNNPSITFNFLPLDLQGYSDDLYIKMNARGKELTRFENFKSKFLGQFDELISKHNGDETLKNMRKEFSKKIDTDWLDVFWDLQKDKSKCEHFDNTLLNFFEIIFINSYSLYIQVLDLKEQQKTDQEKKEQEKINELKDNLVKWISNPRKIPFRYIFDFENFEQLVKDYFIVLNAISDKRQLKLYLNASSKYNEKERFINMVNDISGDNKRYRDRLYFYAYYSYLLKHSDYKLNKFCSNIDVINFDHWIRLAYNLISNIPYINNETDFIHALNSLKFIIDSSDTDIYEDYLKLDLSKLKGIDESQLIEEKIKILLMKKSSDWKKSILAAENQKYFKGQLAFAISYAIGNKSIIDTPIDDIVTNIGKSKFDRIVAITFTLFDDSGISDSALLNFRLQRALLALSDSYYMLKSGSKYSFIINNHRDVSWKNYFKGVSTFEERKYYYELIDNPKFNYKDLNSLEEICKLNAKNNSVITNLFVTHPDIFTYKPINNEDMLPVQLGNSEFIDWNNDNEPIYILSGKQLNGYHNELRSECKYFDFINNKLSFPPFSEIAYYATKSLDETPCLVLNNWKIDEHDFAIDCVWNSKKEYFNLYFFDRKEKITDISSNIEAILNSNNFQFSQKEMRYKTTGILYDALEKFLDNFCDLLQSTISQ